MCQFTLYIFSTYQISGYQFLRVLIGSRKSAVTKSGTGTWDVGCGNAGAWGRGDAGTWDARTQGLGDVGTRGLGDMVRGDFGTRRRAGIRRRDKQVTPDFCDELVKYSFFEGQM